MSDDRDGVLFRYHQRAAIRAVKRGDLSVRWFVVGLCVLALLAGLAVRWWA